MVQMYMAWIQSCHKTNWHSLICAHVKDTASSIRGMYTRMLEEYPTELWDGEDAPAFKPYERSQNIRQISGRGCRVTLGSSENQNAVRGADYAMAHLSETAFWSNSTTRTPEQFIQAICGGIALLPYTLIVIESTANGVGNYFHTEWMRCKSGLGDKHAVFVPWYEIDMYRISVSDARRVLAAMDEYEQRLWRMGLDSEQIAWYRLKSKEYASAAQMQAEFPTDDVEAFAGSGSGVFSLEGIEALRSGCCAPGAVGEVSGGVFTGDAAGALALWEYPVKGMRYVVAVDVGGRSVKSDWSVIAVLKVPPQGLPEVVAQWRGHIDHDLLADKAEKIARYYSSALLVIESNTFETSEYGGVAASNLFVLSRLAERYPNVYRRRSFDRANNTYGTMVGFHTNSSTKALLINGLIERVRDGGYIERDMEACNEMSVYEQRSNGSFGAKIGYHDDILMTRAIALHVISTELPPPCRPIEQVPSW